MNEIKKRIMRYLNKQNQRHQPKVRPNWTVYTTTPLPPERHDEHPASLSLGSYYHCLRLLSLVTGSWDMKKGKNENSFSSSSTGAYCTECDHHDFTKGNFLILSISEWNQIAIEPNTGSLFKCKQTLSFLMIFPQHWPPLQVNSSSIQRIKNSLLAFTNVQESKNPKNRMITFLTLGFVNPQMQIPEGEKRWMLLDQSLNNRTDSLSTRGTLAECHPTQKSTVFLLLL